MVFLALVSLQTCIALVLPERLQRRVSMLAQLLFVIAVIEWLVFAPGMLVRLAAIDPGATSETLAAADSPYQFVGLTSSRAGIWLPPVWFLGIYEVIWGFDAEAFRRLAGTGVLALVATFSTATLAYCAVFRRVVRHALEALPDTARRTGPISRTVTRLAGATILRHPVEQALVAFAARSLARSRRHRLLVAAYVGLGLAFVAGSFLSPVTGLAENALSESLSAPSARLLSVPLVLSFFVLAALRVLFTIPTEIRANRIFRMTEIDDKAVYLNGSRKAMWLLGALPIAGVTFPAYAACSGDPVPALQPHRLLAADVRLPDGAVAAPLPQGAVRLQLRARQGEREVPVAGVRPRPDGVRLLDGATGGLAAGRPGPVEHRVRPSDRLPRNLRLLCGGAGSCHRSRSPTRKRSRQRSRCSGSCGPELHSGGVRSCQSVACS